MARQGRKRTPKRGARSTPSRKVATTKLPPTRSSKQRKPKKPPQPRKPQRNTKRKDKALLDYHTRRKVLQPVVDFKIPLTPTPAWSRKVKSYYRYLIGSPDRPGISAGVRQRISVPGRGKKAQERLLKLQKEAGQGDLPGFKYAWVMSALDPKSGRPYPVDVHFNDDGPNVISVNGVGHMTMLFNQKELAKDPGKEVNRILNDLIDIVEAGGFKHYIFNINCGAYIIPSTLSAQDIIDRVIALMQRYASGRAVVNRDPDKHWEEWLNGVTIQFARRQQTISKLFADRENQREASKRIKQLNIAYVEIMDTISSGPKNVEAIAYNYAGSKDDPKVRLQLAEMKRQGLINGDDNSYNVTAAGKAYMKEGIKLRNFFRR